MVIKPTWLGQPMYPNGWPLSPKQITAGEKTVHDIYYGRWDFTDEENPKENPWTEDEEETIKSYIIYNLNAPIWTFEEPLPSEGELLKLSIDQLFDKCMEIGIDPL